MTESKKTAIVIAGPNGAGKTTFVESYLKRHSDCDEFLNADLIAAGLSPFAPERHNLEASEIFLKRLNQLERGDQSFAVETTLSGRGYAGRIRKWKELGFRVFMFFLWLPDEETAVARVANRVEQGGHNIPEPDIRRRYQRGIRNLVNRFLGLADQLWVFDTTSAPPGPILERSGAETNVLNESLWSQIQSQAND